jgi:hypothetical protein
MNDLGMNGGGEPTTLTVKRHQAGHLNVEVGNAHGSMSTEVSPYQPFPTAFAPLFPNGWTDLAAREGFELTKDFQAK